MQFSDFCNNCEKISASSKTMKKKNLEVFLEKCRKRVLEDSSFTLFSILRLLLPHADRSRGAYGIKEATLAKMYVKIFCLPKNGPDACRLIQHRVPKTSQSVSKDFADVVYNVLRKRCSPGTSSLTVEDINTFLDNLSRKESTEPSKTSDMLLQPLLAKLSAVEQKWLIRIILKNVKVAGLNEKAVFTAFHPDAKELYDVSNDLEKVCTSLMDPLNRIFGIEISLFKPFRPMLADRVHMSKILTKMGSNPFYVETKLDGERTQIHKSGKRYGFYTRRGFDYTKYYGADPKLGNFTPRLDDCFQECVTNCILDGEMVVWNVSGSFIVSKGENTDVKSLSPTGNLVPCFFVFDILLLNDKVLTNVPYKERLELLESAVNVKENTLYFPNRKLVSTKAEVIELLNEAIDSREEGIVLKNPDSIYKPNDRKGGWVKVKPEYVDSMMDHLDLIILGGYHGQGRRRDLISMFLVGVAVPSTEPGQPPHEFYSFARVGSGYSDEQLLKLLQKLNPHWKKWDKNAPPTMIHCGREKPDVWIDPRQSVILEIKASEIVFSNSYKALLTLRFPRVERIREDRSWDSAMTLSEVKEMQKEASGKLATRHCNIDEGEPSSKRRKVAASSTVGVDAPFLPADVSDVKASSNCFSRKVMCVLNGSDDLTKQELERKIVSGGGDIEQNPGKSTFCVVAERDDIRVKSIKVQLKWDVVRPSWILRCLASDRLLPYRPEDLMVVTRATEEEMEKHYDRFGNSLTELTRLEEVPLILQRVKDLVNPKPLSISDIAKLEFEIFGQVHKYGIFRTCVVYVDVWEKVSDPSSKIISGELEIISLDLRMYGADVVKVMDLRVTHVVCDPLAHPQRVSDWKLKNREQEVKFHLVRSEWVLDSINKGSLVDEMAYTPV